MKDYNTYYKTASGKEKEFVGNITHIQPNDISLLFFKDDNIAKLNTELIDQIKNQTFERYGQKMAIMPQQKHIMLVIMRYVYFKNIKNTGTVDDQIDMLNNKTIELLVPGVLQALVSYIKYINDYNTVKVSNPLELPSNTKSRK